MKNKEIKPQTIIHTDKDGNTIVVTPMTRPKPVNQFLYRAKVRTYKHDHK